MIERRVLARDMIDTATPPEFLRLHPSSTTRPSFEGSWVVLMRDGVMQCTLIKEETAVDTQASDSPYATPDPTPKTTSASPPPSPASASAPASAPASASVPERATTPRLAGPAAEVGVGGDVGDLDDLVGDLPMMVPKPSPTVGTARQAAALRAMEERRSRDEISIVAAIAKVQEASVSAPAAGSPREGAGGAGGAGMEFPQTSVQMWPGARGDGRHCWHEPPATNFNVRGPTYLRDRIKVPSDPSAYKMVGMDVLLSPPGTGAGLLNMQGTVRSTTLYYARSTLRSPPNHHPKERPGSFVRRLREQYKREQKQRRKDAASGPSTPSSGGGAPPPRSHLHSHSGSGSGSGSGSASGSASGSGSGSAGRAYYTDTDRDLRHLSMDVVSPGGDLGPGGPPFVLAINFVLPFGNFSAYFSPRHLGPDPLVGNERLDKLLRRLMVVRAQLVALPRARAYKHRSSHNQVPNTKNETPNTKHQTLPAHRTLPTITRRETNRSATSV